jgi:hypothetical protein
MIISPDVFELNLISMILPPWDMRQRWPGRSVQADSGVEPQGRVIAGTLANTLMATCLFHSTYTVGKNPNVRLIAA